MQCVLSCKELALKTLLGELLLDYWRHFVHTCGEPLSAWERIVPGHPQAMDKCFSKKKSPVPCPQL